MKQVLVTHKIVGPHEIGAIHKIGIDEAGRGPIAGPVVAAAAWINPFTTPQNLWANIKDSKTLSSSARRKILVNMRPYSKIGLGVASVAEIDQINIHYATLLAMSRAFDRLVGRFVSDSASQRFDAHVFVDGKFCPNLPYRTQAVIGGDRTDASIGLASIAAKFYRDWLMGRLDRRYPWYDWKKNKGYPTKQHLEHLNQHGPNQHFRFSYGPLFSWKEKAS